ncbi:Enoyl-CoA hydratase/isomerase [Paraburkholderia tropica]|uniref:Enoyl-CoA hydratase/isomerase n=1 Tax=Paraburkholderia tropica TaxID=92647 RepID=A0AAQ1JX13_9BURK|nr:Enoyl-CoA hydratase/isomerase [Paraburkholderia tropica]
MVEHIKQALSQGILTLTIARADKKNALTNDMYGALADALTQAEKDDAIRVVLIQADGDMFTAGNDLAEFAEQSAGNGPEECRSFASCARSPTRRSRSSRR